MLALWTQGIPLSHSTSLGPEQCYPGPMDPSMHATSVIQC